jgi:hypothetical protein
MLAATIGPIVIRASRNYNLNLLIRFFANCTYTWMGFLFLLVCALLLTDSYRFILYFVGRVSGHNLAGTSLTARTWLLLAFSGSVIATIYGVFEANHIRLRTITMTSPKIPVSVGPLRIVHISDIHLGLIVRQHRISRVLEKAKKARPDLLVSILLMHKWTISRG